MELIEHEEKTTEEHRGTEDNELVLHLETNGYRVCAYPNGLLMGLRMQPVPGSRGVHIDVVHILDMRKARFGRTTLAVQSAILETIKRDVQHLLSDVGLEGLFETQEVVTPLGRSELRLLRPTKRSSPSLIYETRLVYAVHSNDAVPPATVQWLAEPSKIIRVSEFSLLHKSDSRSLLQDVRTAIEQQKWKDLEHGYRASWWSLLPLIVSIASMIGLASSFLTASGMLSVPLVALTVSVPILVWLGRIGASRMDRFCEALDLERSRLEAVGALSHIQRAVALNQEKLRLAGNLRFVVTPLMDGAAVAVESGDIAAAVSSLCTILDECVRLSPRMSDDRRVKTDAGLEKFLDLFIALGVDLTDDEEMELGLAYTAITGHGTATLSEGELITHMGVLNNCLFDCGVLSPDVKSTIDDMMNYRELGTLLTRYSEPDPEKTRVSSEASDNTEDGLSEIDDETGIDDETLKEMSIASLNRGMHRDYQEPSESEGTSPNSSVQEDDEPPAIEKDTVQITLEEDLEDTGRVSGEVVVAKAVRSGNSASKAKKKEREPVEA